MPWSVVNVRAGATHAFLMHWSLVVNVRDGATHPSDQLGPNVKDGEAGTAHNPDQMFFIIHSTNHRPDIMKSRT